MTPSLSEMYKAAKGARNKLGRNSANRPFPLRGTMNVDKSMKNSYQTAVKKVRQ